MGWGKGMSGSLWYSRPCALVDHLVLTALCWHHDLRSLIVDRSAYYAGLDRNTPAGTTVTCRKPNRVRMTGGFAFEVLKLGAFLAATAGTSRFTLTSNYASCWGGSDVPPVRAPYM